MKKKSSLNDRLFMIALPVMMVAILALTAFVSMMIEKKRSSGDEEQVRIVLEELQAEAAKNHPELNSNYLIWQDELVRLRDHLPTESGIMLDSVITEADWMVLVNKLIEQITTVNISDEAFAETVINALPDQLREYILKNYFKVFTLYLNPNLFSQQETG